MHHGGAGGTSISTWEAFRVGSWWRRLVGDKHRRAWWARMLFIVAFAWLLVSAGCEVLTFERTQFPDTLRGADGQVILLDDVNAILNDAGLDDAGKRAALRDLGIEDEDLLDALLAG